MKLSDVCSYVTNTGLSPSASATAKPIQKTPQSTWFDWYCTSCTLTVIVLVAGCVMSHIWCKNTQKFPISKNSCPLIVSIQYFKKTIFPYSKHVSLNSYAQDLELMEIVEAELIVPDLLPCLTDSSHLKILFRFPGCI